MSGAPQPSLPQAAQLQAAIRRRVPELCYDASGEPPRGVAIYSLSDPRTLGEIRYIGQSASPRRRLLEHLCVARLWLPDELPWWVKSPRLRPLYQWIRELHHDGGRLPVMVVRAWVEAAEARLAERSHICECLQKQLPLLNVEEQRLRRQLQLL